MRRRSVALSVSLVAAFVFCSTSLQAVSIVIVNKDPAGVGFNDPTPASPVGGNSGTTLGQQRLNVFQAAASIWGSKLSSPVTIKISASFGSLTPCDTSSGVLGSAGPTNFLMNFTNAPRANTWYPVALASALSGTDQAAGLTDGASIQAQFNSNIGTSGCLPTVTWYLGLDANHGGQVDLETVLLHEFGHGLGFIGLVSLSDGTFSGTAFPDVFSYSMYDNSAFMHYNLMSNAQRLTSLINVGNVVFDGSNVTGGASILTTGKDGSGHPLLYTPNPSEQGSSLYHFDTSASPNLLMEPAINGDLTHNVDLPNDLTMKAMLDFGWPSAALAAPTGVNASAGTATSVTVKWNTATGATSYHVYRNSSASPGWSLISTGACNNPASTGCADTVAAGYEYAYKVRAYNGAESADSNIDLANTMTFTDPTITAQSTLVKAAHVTELRNAVIAVCAIAGNTPVWTTTPAGGGIIRAADVTDIRSNLDTARGLLGLATGGWTDSTLASGTTSIKAAHITEIRSAVQ